MTVELPDLALTKNAESPERKIKRPKNQISDQMRKNSHLVIAKTSRFPKNSFEKAVVDSAKETF
ncbi:hypothetical protein JMUB7521_27060 [Staphylococcus aureus]